MYIAGRRRRRRRRRSKDGEKCVLRQTVSYVQIQHKKAIFSMIYAASKYVVAIGMRAR